MNYFKSIEISEKKDDLLIIVHMNEDHAHAKLIGLEDPMTEFASSFWEQAGDRLDVIREHAKKYIQEHPIEKPLKRALVVVMLGTAVVTSFPLTNEALAANDPSIMSVSNTYKVVAGDTLWKIATANKTTVDELLTLNKLNSDMIYPDQLLILPTLPTSTEPPIITYTTHVVGTGDNAWNISIKYGIPMSELLKVNQLTMTSTLNINQTLKIPIHSIPVRPVAAIGKGEFLDWNTEAQYIIPIGKKIVLTDVKTGVSWNAVRTIGAGHADTEPATASDAAIMKSVWGGKYAWTPRAVLVKVDGRTIAAAALSMPHGVESIMDNNYTGHFCLHFKNSIRHKDGLVDPAFQAQIRIAAGLVSV